MPEALVRMSASPMFGWAVMVASEGPLKHECMWVFLMEEGAMLRDAEQCFADVIHALRGHQPLSSVKTDAAFCRYLEKGE